MWLRRDETGERQPGYRRNLCLRPGAIVIDGSCVGHDQYTLFLVLSPTLFAVYLLFADFDFEKNYHWKSERAGIIVKRLQLRHLLTAFTVFMIEAAQADGMAGD